MADKKPKQKPSKSQISTNEKESRAVVNKTDHFIFVLWKHFVEWIFYG
jgi:hypothetical protein